MTERFQHSPLASSTPESREPLNAAQEHEARELIRLLEEGIASCEAAEIQWAANLNLLAERVPHDDVLMDDRTLPYDALRNAWLANLYELEEQKARLQTYAAEVHRMLAVN